MGMTAVRSWTVRQFGMVENTDPELAAMSEAALPAAVLRRLAPVTTHPSIPIRSNEFPICAEKFPI
jgi:hypothetical protein